MINTEPRAKIRSSTTPAQLRRGGVGRGGGDRRKSASGIELFGVLQSERYSTSGARCSQNSSDVSARAHTQAGKHTPVTRTHPKTNRAEVNSGLTCGCWRESYVRLWTRWSAAGGSCVSAERGWERPRPEIQFGTSRPPQNHPCLAEIKEREEHVRRGDKEN